jgi:hypothetical protein
MVPSAGKVMTSVLWDENAIVRMKFLPKWAPVTLTTMLKR